MKKQIIFSFTCGAVLFGAIGAFAGQYVATENPFPIKLNGSDVSIEGYNIDGSTYFKLRDIADAIGGFYVGFENNTIQLAKDGYVYETAPVRGLSKYVGTYSKMSRSLGFSWVLSISSAGNDGVVFDYSYEKPGSTYVTDKAIFTDNSTAIADGKVIYGKGTEYQREEAITYTLHFEDDGVNVSLSDGSSRKFSFDDKTSEYNAVAETSSYTEPAIYESPEEPAYANNEEQEALLNGFFMGYPEGYEKVTDYEKYNSYASYNGLRASKIVVGGRITEVSQQGNTYYAIIDSYYEPGEKWFVYLTVTDYNASLTAIRNLLEGQYVNAAGEYLGYSETFSMPGIILERIFTFPSGAYTVEDLALMS